MPGGNTMEPMGLYGIPHDPAGCRRMPQWHAVASHDKVTGTRGVPWELRRDPTRKHNMNGQSAMSLILTQIVPPIYDVPIAAVMEEALTALFSTIPACVHTYSSTPQRAVSRYDDQAC